MYAEIIFIYFLGEIRIKAYTYILILPELLVYKNF